MRVPSPNRLPLKIPCLQQQIVFLRELFPTANLPSLESSAARETRDRGFVYRPSLALWGQFLDRPSTPADYGALLAGAIDRMSLSRFTCRNYCDQTSVRCRIAAPTQEALVAMERGGFYDVHLLSIDVGEYHAGRTPHEVASALRTWEFGLDPLTMLGVLYVCMRYSGSWNDVYHVACPGGQYDPAGNGQWADTTRFDIERGEIALDWNWSVRWRALHVNATAFVL